MRQTPEVVEHDIPTAPVTMMHGSCIPPWFPKTAMPKTKNMGGWGQAEKECAGNAPCLQRDTAEMAKADPWLLITNEVGRVGKDRRLQRRLEPTRKGQAHEVVTVVHNPTAGDKLKEVCLGFVTGLRTRAGKWVRVTPKAPAENPHPQGGFSGFL